MNQENITRTLATGQSDITRHEAYTKAQGLYEYCLIEADGVQKAHILMNCSIDPNMPVGRTKTAYEMILAQCTGRLYIQSETIWTADIKKIPMNDFTKLWDLSVNLIDTNMELYFKMVIE